VSYYKFTAESVLKEFFKYLNIWQNYGEKFDCGLYSGFTMIMGEAIPKKNILLIHSLTPHPCGYYPVCNYGRRM